MLWSPRNEVEGNPPPIGQARKNKRPQKDIKNGITKSKRIEIRISIKASRTKKKHLCFNSIKKTLPENLFSSPHLIELNIYDAKYMKSINYKIKIIRLFFFFCMFPVKKRSRQQHKNKYQDLS